MTLLTHDIAAKVLKTVDAGLCKGLGVAEPGQMCVEAAVCYAMDLPHGDNPPCVSEAVRMLKIVLNDKSWSSNTARAAGLRRLAIAQLGSAGVVDDKMFATKVAELAIRKMVPTALRAAASVIKDKERIDQLMEAAYRCAKEGTRDAALHARNTATDSDPDAYADAAAYADTAADTAVTAATAAYNTTVITADAAACADAADTVITAVTAYTITAVTAAADSAAAAAYAYGDAYSAKDKVLAEFAEGVVQILIELESPGCAWLYLTDSN